MNRKANKQKRKSDRIKPFCLPPLSMDCYVQLANTGPEVFLASVQSRLLLQEQPSDYPGTHQGQGQKSPEEPIRGFIITVANTGSQCTGEALHFQMLKLISDVQTSLFHFSLMWKINLVITDKLKGGHLKFKNQPFQDIFFLCTLQ